MENEIIGNFTIEKYSDKAVYRQGETASFTLKVFNTGNIALLDMAIKEELDNHFEFVSDSIKLNNVKQIGDLNSDIGVGNVQKGELVIVTFQAIAKTIGQNIKNKVEVNTTYKDKNDQEILLTKNSNEINLTIQEYKVSLNVKKEIHDVNCYLNDIKKFTITITNSGNVQINDVLVIDDLDNKFKFIENSIKINGHPYSGNLEDLIPIDFIEPASIVTVSFEVLCNNVGSARNSAEVTGTYLNELNTKVNIARSSNVVLVNIKKADTAHVDVYKNVLKEIDYLNQVAKYKIFITNNGIVNFNDIRITDLFDDGLQLIQDSIKINNTTIDYSAIDNLDLGNLAVSEQTVVEFQARIIKDKSEILNKAKVIANYQDEGGLTKEITKESNVVLVNVLTDIRGKMLFTKSVDNAEVSLGDNVHFILYFKNVGSVDLEHVTLADNLSEYFEYVANSTKIDKQIKGDIITGITFDKMLINEEHRIDFDVKAIKAENHIPNTAVMAAYYGKEILNPITNEVYVDILKGKNMSAQFTKETDKDTYYQGEEIKFILKVKNSGTITLDKVDITDQLNDNVKLISNTTYVDNELINDIDGGVSLNNIEKGKEKNVSFKCLAIKKANNLTNMANATIKYMENNEIKTSNMQSETSFNITDVYLPELTIEKSANESIVSKNDIVNVTLRLTNSGNITLTNINLADVLPMGLLFVKDSLMVDYVKVDGDITKGIIIDDMPKNYVTFVTFRALVGDSEGIIQNQAFATYNYVTLAGGSDVGFSSSNVYDFNYTEDTVASISAIKSSDKNSYLVNDEVTFSITLENFGNTLANDVVIQDNLDDAYTFIDNSLKIDGVLNSGNVVKGVNIGKILNGEKKILEFKVLANQLKPLVKNKLNFTYTYNNKFNEIITKEGNSNEIINHIIDGKAHMSIIKSSVNKAVVGEDLKFSLTIQNDGQKDISNIIIQDSLVPNIKFINNSIRVDKNPVSGDITTGINIGSLMPNEITTVTFDTLMLTSESNLENVALGTYQYLNGDVIVSDKTSSNVCIFNVLDNKNGSVSVEKTAQYENIYLNSVNTFTINIQNIGDIDLTNVKVIDLLDFKYELIKGSVMINDKKTNYDLTNIVVDSLNKGTNAIVTFQALAKTVGHDIVNEASVQFEYLDENSQKVSEVIYSLPIKTNIVLRKMSIISMVKKIDKYTSSIGDTSIVTLTVINSGNVKADLVKIIDVLPANYEFVKNSIKINGIINYGNIETGISINNMDANEKDIITFNVMAKKDGTDIQNVASANYFYVNAFNNMINETSYSNIINTVITDKKVANILIGKTMLKQSLLVNDTNTVVATIQNIGNIKATNIEVRDILNDNYEVIPNTLLYNDSKIAGDIVQGININDLESLDIAKISFDIKAKKIGYNIPNRIKVNYDYTVDLEIFNETSISNVVFTDISSNDRALLKVDKTCSLAKVEEGQSVKYYVDITNVGTLPAENIKVIDVLPIETKFIDGTIYIDGNNDIQETNEEIRMFNLNPNKKAEIEIEALALTKGETSNEAVIDYEYTDEIKGTLKKVALSNKEQLIILEKKEGLLNVTQTVDKVTLTVGDINVFKFVIQNIGNTDVFDINLNSYISQNYNVIESSIKIDPDNLTLLTNQSLELGSLKPGEIKSVTFSAFANMVGADIVNIANLTYKYADALGEIIFSGVSSNEVLTNITEDGSALIQIDHDINVTMEKGKEEIVTLTITNIGNKLASNVLVKVMIDPAFKIVPNSLIVDGVSSNQDILVGVLFDTITFNSIHTIIYKLNPTKVGTNFPIKTESTYVYVDKNNIDRGNESIYTNLIDVFPDNNIDVSFVKDSNKKDYFVNDLAIFRIIITNNSDRTLTDAFIKDVLPNNYTFIDNSLRLNGELFAGNINNGININLKANDKAIITFEAKAKIFQKGIVNNALFTYSYLDLHNVKQTKTIYSSFTTNIYETDVPVLIAEKKSKIKKVTVNNDNTFYISIYNKSDRDVSNVLVQDILDENYLYKANTLRINNLLIDSKLSSISVGMIEGNSSVIISFDATAKMVKNAIENYASIQYSYENRDNVMVDDYLDSNIITTDIIENFNQYAIDLIASISSKEVAIGTIVTMEYKKLLAVLKKDATNEAILNINNSIKNMIIILTELEIITKDDLAKLLD